MDNQNQNIPQAQTISMIPSPQSPSRLGLLSFLLSFMPFLLYFGILLWALTFREDLQFVFWDLPEVWAKFVFLLGVFIVSLWIDVAIRILGMVFSCIVLFQSDRKKGFALMGLFFNFFGFCAASIFLVIRYFFQSTWQ